MEGPVPGSGAGRTRRRGRRRTTRCSLSPRLPAVPNTPTGWTSGCSSSSTWRCSSSCTSCPEWFT